MGDSFEDKAEPTVTIGEYIEELEAEDLEADLVMGGDDGKGCTYGVDYMKRQAIFSCLTRVPGDTAGVCTGCSLTCHDGHEIPRDGEGEPVYEDFICQECAVICSFLKLYPASVWASSNQKSTLQICSSHVNILEYGSSTSADMTKNENGVLVNDTRTDCFKNDPACQTVSSEKTPFNSGIMESDVKPNADSHTRGSDLKCRLEMDAGPVVLEKKEPMFLQKYWRSSWLM